MSQIPTTSTFRVEDYPSQREWIGKFFTGLNQFIQGTTQSVNGNVDFGSNIPCVTKSLSVTTATTSFQYTLPKPPTEVKVCQARKNGVPVIVQIAWSFSNGVVTITKMTDETGVPITGKHDLIFRALP